MSDPVKINVIITQHVFKSDIEDINNFREKFKSPGVTFWWEDLDDELEIKDLFFDNNVGKCLDKGETYARIIDCTISFKVNSIDKLKEFWEDEIIVDNKVKWQKFVSDWIGNVNPVFLDYKNTKEVHGNTLTGINEVWINKFEVTGTMQLNKEVLK